jgi:hypothetical protein
VANVKGVFFLLLLVFASAANAIIINVDPARFEPGTGISNSFTGVSLSNISGGYPPGTPLTSSSIYALECAPCAGDTNGQVVFGHGPLSFGYDVADYIFDYSDFAARYYEEDYSSSYDFIAGRWNALRIDFHQPTSYVHLIGGGASNGNFFVMDLWGTDGQRLGRCFSGIENTQCSATPIGGEPDPSKIPWAFTFTSLDADISYITAGGWAGGQYVHSLTFSSVPEPSTLILFGLGLAGLIFRTKSRVPQGLCLRPTDHSPRPRMPWTSRLV